MLDSLLKETNITADLQDELLNTSIVEFFELRSYLELEEG